MKTLLRLEQSAVSPIRDMGLIFMLLLTNAFYSCEEKYFPAYMDAFRLLLAFLLLSALFTSGFMNGFMKRWSFAVFVLSLWLIPILGIVFLTEFSTANGIGRVFYDLFVLLHRWPFSPLSNLLPLSELVLSTLTFGSTLILFATGFLVKKRIPS